VWQHKVRLQGNWVAGAQILLDNRVRGDVVGYDVLTPLLQPNGSVLPVIRGWVPRGVAGAPQVSVPEGEVNFVARIIPPTQRYLELSADTVAGSVWQNIDWKRYRSFVKRPVVAALAYQLDGGDSMLREEPQQAMGADRHYMYAGTWFLFASLAIALFIILHWKRSPR
jgi:surfeit locus 1 family protein